VPSSKLADFAELVTGRAPGRSRDDEITIYKAVGVALQDICVAALAYERITPRA
jgi:ornithine cyclodeaminase